MRKFYQTEWFDIEFTTFTNLSSSQIADQKFYEKFYEKFYKNFSSYTDLPQDWQDNKNLLVEYLLQSVQNKNNILSIGCGMGYIEDKVSKSAWKGKLTVIEPSVTATKWLKQDSSIELVNGYFPNAIKKREEFDMAYISYVDYVFDDLMYIKFLTDIKNYPINDLLLLGVSVYEPNIKEILKDIAKNLLSKLGLFNQQLWGYQRTIQEHISILEKVGFKNIELGKFENGVDWIRVRND